MSISKTTQPQTPRDQWYRWPSWDYENRICHTKYGVDVLMTEELEVSAQLLYESIGSPEATR